MDQSLEELGGSAPSLLLTGMRGAGKTTLGRLAAEHLKVAFVDADELFTQRHAPLVPKTFVAAHGWPAFRAEETKILRELLREIQEGHKPMVASLGGGIVEEECNRRLLKDSWSSKETPDNFDPSRKTAVVHIFREVDNVLLDQRGLPSWGVANGHEVWERRRPWFRESSSHEFVNFTDADYLKSVQGESSREARLRFEAVERDFVAFLIRLLKVFERRPSRFLPSRKTRSYLATLPFADLRPHVDQLPVLTLGVDAVELRADLLRDPHARSGVKIIEAYENPSLSYLSEQIALIRRHLPDYPLVFTLRTPAQGGRYPYPADAPAEALFRSLHHALKLGCDMIDIEMKLDPVLTKMIIKDAKARNISVLISWRDKLPPQQGGFSWSGTQARALFEEAAGMGADIVKIVGTAGQVSDNFALRVFAASLDESGEEARQAEDIALAVGKPLLSAYNMGYKGRISRFLNPVMASVTHDIAKQLTTKGVIGNPSMTFNEVQRALHLSGLLEKASFLHLYADEDTRVSMMYRAWFDEMGLPFSMDTQALGTTRVQDIVDSASGLHGDLCGLVLSEGIDVVNQVQGDDSVEVTGYCDTIIVDPSGALLGFNKLVQALLLLIKGSISPSIHLNKRSTALVLCRDKTSALAKSAVHALVLLGLDSILTRNPSVDEASLATRPSVIIDVHGATSSAFSGDLCQKLLSNDVGGLLVSLAEKSLFHQLIKDSSHNPFSWRYIDHQTVQQHTHFLRFRLFTGRRAPVSLGSA